MASHVLDKILLIGGAEKGILALVRLTLLALAFFMGFQTQIAHAGTTVELRESYAGNMSFALTGGTLLQGNDCNATISSRSSTEAFNGLPSGAKVVAAWLYWAGSYNPNYFSSIGVRSPDSTVTFTTPLGSQSITATTMYVDNFVGDSSEAYFNGKADVTSYVANAGNGIYGVSNLASHTRSPHCDYSTIIAGWALTVVYESSSEPFRVVNIFDGFQYYYGSQISLTPDNFTVSSNPSGKHAHITWEGDANNSGSRNGLVEALKFQGFDLTDSNNPSNNQFNSYSNVMGKTTLGVDIDSYPINSTHIAPGATSATTQYSSGADMVFLTSEILSISNIPVADLSVTTSDPTGWQEGSTVTKKFTISNNGPNDVPAQSVEFTTTLPTQLSFSGSQGDSDWSCSQAGQTLTCRYQPKLRAGWSDYIDLRFNVAANSAPSTANLSVSVNHDNAPYDIFDNHTENDVYQFNVPIVTTPVVDLSASSKTYTNLSGDLLLAGDTLRYVITIDDASDLTVSGIRVTDNLPANISGFTLLSFPSGATNNSSSSGGSNGTGYLDISNINLAAGATEEIELEVYVSSSAPEGASLQNTANISYSSNNWLVDTGDITVVKPDLSASTKEATDINAGWLLPGETALYTITIDDAGDLELTGVQLTDNLPANIASFNIVSLPAGATDYSLVGGGSNGTGYIDIRDIYLASGDTVQIQIEVVVDENAAEGVSLKNTAVLGVNSATWNIESNELIVSLDNNTPASGNKPLYMPSSNLSRLIPTSNTTRSFRHGDTLRWDIDTDLISDLTLAAGDMSFNLAIEGHRTGSIQSRFFVSLIYNDNNGSGDQIIATDTSDYGNYRINTDYDVPMTLTLAAPVTIPEGSTLSISIYNQSSNNSSNSYSEIDVNAINPTSGNYSVINLNASTVINVDSVTVWDATYGDPNGSGAGNLVANSQPDTDLFIRAVISDPFGAFDITDASISITKANGDSYDFSSHADGNQNQMNQMDTTSDDYTTATKTYEKQITLLETGESTGWWTLSITGYEGQETFPDQVTHTNVTSFRIKPFQPNIALTKSIVVLTDPINGTTNPKAIPGSELQYTIAAKNSGRGSSDDSSLILTDEVPNNAEFYVGNIACASNSGPVCFNDGVNPNESELSFTFVDLTDATDDLEFSQDGSDFSYVPDDADGDLYDPAIRYIRVKPQGSFKASDKTITFEPEFNFQYQIRLQ